MESFQGIQEKMSAPIWKPQYGSHAMGDALETTGETLICQKMVNAFMRLRPPND